MMLPKHNPSRSWRLGARRSVFAMWLVLMSLQPLFAVGTAAGITITNQAGVTYTVGVSNLNASSNLESFVVDHRVDLTVTETSGGYTVVSAGATQQVQTFTVTNSGNAPQDFALTPVQQVGGFDPFTGTDPETFNTSAPLVFAESGVTPGYQVAQDIVTLNHAVICRRVAKILTILGLNAAGSRAQNEISRRFSKNPGENTRFSRCNPRSFAPTKIQVSDYK